MRRLTIALIIFLTAGNGLPARGSDKPADFSEKLVNVDVTQTEIAATVSIDITGPVKYHTFRVSSPPRLVVEMIDVKHEWPRREIESAGALLQRVRSGQYRDSPVRITRVVLDMQSDDYLYREDYSDGRINLILELKDEAAVKRIETPARPAAIQPRPEHNIPTQTHLGAAERVLREREAREQREREVRRELAERKRTAADEFEFTPGALIGPLSNEIVNFNFTDADIREVLRTFALKFNRNIIPAENVSGTFSLWLREVPFDEAFQMLLSRMELVAIQRSPNVIEVVRSDMMPTERRTFNLSNRTASGIKVTLDDLLTDPEKVSTHISVDDASNSLIVTATPSVLTRISDLVRQLDIKSPQIKIKARIIEVQSSDSFESAVTWAANIPFQDTEIQRIRAAKDVRFYDIDRTDQSIDPERTIQRAGLGTGPLLDISAVLDEVSLYGLLNLLAEKTNSKTVSEPNIITENNKSAQIHVGRNLPVRTRQTTAEGIIETVEFVTEGVDLQVTPVVSPGSSQIALNVNISVSEFVGFQADSPITQGRSARTEVTVESGKTIVIGGLIRESDIDYDAGIPILKDIPLLGYFFKNRSRVKDRTELLVFLSPEIIID